MTQDEILATIRDVIVAIKRETAPVPPHEVRWDTSFATPPLSMDSLDFVRFLMDVEETFGIVADEADVLRLGTVGDGVRLVSALLVGQEPAWQEPAGRDGGAGDGSTA